MSLFSFFFRGQGSTSNTSSTVETGIYADKNDTKSSRYLQDKIDNQTIKVNENHKLYVDVELLSASSGSSSINIKYTDITVDYDDETKEINLDSVNPYGNRFIAILSANDEESEANVEFTWDNITFETENCTYDKTSNKTITVTCTGQKVLLKQTTPFNVSVFKSISKIRFEPTAIGFGEPTCTTCKVLLSADGVTWKRYDRGVWRIVENPGFDDVQQYGLTFDQISKLYGSDWRSFFEYKDPKSLFLLIANQCESNNTFILKAPIITGDLANVWKLDTHNHTVIIYPNKLVITFSKAGSYRILYTD